MESLVIGEKVAKIPANIFTIVYIAIDIINERGKSISLCSHILVIGKNKHESSRIPNIKIKINLN